MTPEQLGPMGILAVLVGGCVWAMKWMLTRFGRMLDAHEEHAKGINAALTNISVVLSGVVGRLDAHEAREEAVLRQHALELSEARREVVAVREHITDRVGQITGEVEALVVLAVKKASVTQPIEPVDLPVRRRGGG